MGRSSTQPWSCCPSERNDNASLTTLGRMSESSLVKSLWKMESTFSVARSSGICGNGLELTTQGTEIVKDDPDPTRKTEDIASIGTHC